MAIIGIIVVALEVVYTAGSGWIIIRFHREWRSLKRGIVAGQLTDRNMAFMDALIGDDNPTLTGIITAVAWPKFAWDLWRQRRKDRA